MWAWLYVYYWKSIKLLTHHNLELHLLDYYKKVLEYLNVSESLLDTQLVPLLLKSFLEPHDKLGFNSNSISNETITEVFLEFGEKTCNKELDEYTCTLTSMTENLGPYFVITVAYYHFRKVYLRQWHIQSSSKRDHFRLQREAVKDTERGHHNLFKQDKQDYQLGKLVIYQSSIYLIYYMF